MSQRLKQTNYFHIIDYLLLHSIAVTVARPHLGYKKQQLVSDFNTKKYNNAVRLQK